MTGERVAPSTATDASTVPSEATEAPSPRPPPTPPALCNFGGESVAECAARMLARCEQDRRERITAREAARQAAEGCAKSWRKVGNETMSNFYWLVAAHLAQRAAT